MQSTTSQTPVVRSPLETFFHDYVEAAGGLCDQVEPQVYDVLLPSAGTADELDPAGRDVLRVAFDPDAIPEHPGAQLAGFGTPLVDRLLKNAMHAGRRAEAYFNGLNLAPHDLSGRVGRALRLTDGLELTFHTARPLHFAQAVFWFEATFISDQKEQEILPIAMDLHSARQVRHLEQLLDYDRLAEEPSGYLVEARRRSVAAVYPAAREQVVRTIASLANTRRRELDRRLTRQIGRMKRYYEDLRGELDAQVRRARSRDADVSKFALRREAVDREERLRVAELRQKSALRVQLRLSNLLVVHQPKLLVRSAISSAHRPAAAAQLDLVWDPLTERLEAVACPRCGGPTYVFQLDRRSRVACPNCVGSGGDCR